MTIVCFLVTPHSAANIARTPAINQIRKYGENHIAEPAYPAHRTIFDMTEEHGPDNSVRIFQSCQYEWEIGC